MSAVEQSAAFTPRQRAELRDAIARSRIAAREESRRLASARVDRVETPRPRLVVVPETPPLPLPLPQLVPVVTSSALTRDDLTPDEQLRFDRMLAAVGGAEATIDVVTHLARAARRRPS